METNDMGKYKKEALPPTPQKFSWSIKGKYSSFEEANTHRLQLLEAGEKVKVQRMGLKKTVFAVKTAKPVKKVKQETD